MIVVTGAAGFIASGLISKLNQLGHTKLMLVDNFQHTERLANWQGKSHCLTLRRELFPAWLNNHGNQVRFVYHLGARTDTAEFNMDVLNELNLEYTKSIWKACTNHQIPLVYASSAATYGLGEHGFEDRDDLPPSLEPLNPYGVSKNEFDKWVLQQTETPPTYKGVKFFNVYGPNEYHKGRMASVVFHAFNQIKATGGMKLFRSHRADVADGEQRRDFIYVKDAANVLAWMFDQKGPNGLYNLGTGEARTFKALAETTFEALGLAPNISFVDTPEDIRDKYQYFTEATMQKLRHAGYTLPFTSLEEGVKDYVQNYLNAKLYY